MPSNFTNTTHVMPGAPVTAQAWNAIVDGLAEVQALLSTASRSVQARVTGDPRDVVAARAIAVGPNGEHFAAVTPTNPSGFFVFPKLPAGAYTIVVSAPSCPDVPGTVSVHSDATVSTFPDPFEFVLAPSKRMPNVLGAKWKDALALLTLTPVSPRVLDASGKGVPLTGFDPAYADVPVLMQWPDPEEIVPAGKDPYVILATIVKPAVLVPTPNFIGMTIAEAQTAAAKLGLTIKIV